jgi:hypothetical protein
MKRIYQLNTTPVQYFETKEAAKVARGAKVPAKDDKPEHYKFTVSKGPDHPKFGERANERTHSYNSRSGGHDNGFPARRK